MVTNLWALCNFFLDHSLGFAIIRILHEHVLGVSFIFTFEALLVIFVGMLFGACKYTSYWPLLFLGKLDHHMMNLS